MANINFSVGKMSYNLIKDGKSETKTVYSPFIQQTGVLTLSSLARHMSEHNSKYDEGDIMAVLIQFVKCASEMLLEGYKIDLNDLGEFRFGVKTTSEETADAVTANNIVKVFLAWSAGKRTNDLRSKAEFTRVAQRRNQRLLISAENNGQTSMTLNQSSSSGSGSANGGVSGE